MPVFFKNKRIAAYIRTGLTRMEESKNDWFHSGSKVMGCALGLAVAGKLGTRIGHACYIDALVKHKGDEIQAISEILEIKPLLAEEINKLHQLDVPAIEIAECLEFEIGDEQYDDFRPA